MARILSIIRPGHSQLDLSWLLQERFKGLISSIGVDALDTAFSGHRNSGSLVPLTLRAKPLPFLLAIIAWISSYGMLLLLQIKGFDWLEWIREEVTTVHFLIRRSALDINWGIRRIILFQLLGFFTHFSTYRHCFSTSERVSSCTIQSQVRDGLRIRQDTLLARFRFWQLWFWRLFRLAEKLFIFCMQLSWAFFDIFIRITSNFGKYIVPNRSDSSSFSCCNHWT